MQSQPSLRRAIRRETRPVTRAQRLAAIEQGHSLQKHKSTGCWTCRACGDRIGGDPAFDITSVACDKAQRRRQAEDHRGLKLRGRL